LLLRKDERLSPPAIESTLHVVTTSASTTHPVRSSSGTVLLIACGARPQRDTDRQRRCTQGGPPAVPSRLPFLGFPARVEAIAEGMLEEGQTTPIMVRPDGEEGVGEMTIEGYGVQARKH
jgi:hypothetical protein